MKILRFLILILLAVSPVMIPAVFAQGAQSEGRGAAPLSERLPAFADDDDPPPPDDQPPPGPGGAQGREQRQRHFEEFRLMKMIEVLDLTDQQEVPFTTAYQKMRKEQRALDDNKREALEKLSRAVKAEKPDQNLINGLIDKVVGYEVEKRNLNRRFLDDMRRLLTPEQAGRLVLFAERFDSTVFQRLQAMRQGMMGRGMGKGMRRRPDSTQDSGQ